MQALGNTIQYADRHATFPGVVIVSYPFRWGGCPADRRMWMAELNGSVWDYDAQDALVARSLEDGLPVVVLRVHRDGTASVVRRLHPRSRRGRCSGVVRRKS